MFVFLLEFNEDVGVGVAATCAGPGGVCCEDKNVRSVRECSIVTVLVYKKSNRDCA
jgi:hypothetical protein